MKKHAKVIFRDALRLRFRAEHAAFVGMFAIAAILLLFGYWELWPSTKDIFRFEGPIKILTPQVTSGAGTLAFRIKYYKNPAYDRLRSNISISFVDHIAQPPIVIRESLPNGFQEITQEIPVPILRPGMYHINVARECDDINPVRQHEVVTSFSGEFDVLAPSTVPEEVIDNLRELVKQDQHLKTHLHGLLQSNRDLIDSNRRLADIATRIASDVARSISKNTVAIKSTAADVKKPATNKK